MGGGMAKMLLEKKGVDIVGACARPPKAGKSMYEVIGVPRGSKPEVIVGAPEDIIKDKCADVVLLCTDSYTEKAFDRIKLILEHHINCVTCAEEMAYPQAQKPELAKKLDEIAKANGVSVLGTGINPGLIMDLLVLIWTGCCESVDSITSRRVNSLSPFGPVVMKEQGIGLPVDEFKKEAKEGTISGHIGFHESITMIADALGWKLDKIEQSMDPIVTEVDRKSPFGFA
jgi:4-hydroxy-tetrahydrodipicolinate reductase